jgi:hypothetical protein
MVTIDLNLANVMLHWSFSSIEAFIHTAECACARNENLFTYHSILREYGAK